MTSPLPSYVALGLAPTWPLCRTPLHSPAKTPSWVDQPRNMHQKQTPLLLSRDFGWLPPLALVSWSLFHSRRRCFGLELLVKAQVHTTVAGKPWQHATFKYHAHCVHWIQQEYKALAANAKAAVDDVLAGTGCEKLLDSSTQ